MPIRPADQRVEPPSRHAGPVDRPAGAGLRSAWGSGDPRSGYGAGTAGEPAPPPAARGTEGAVMPETSIAYYEHYPVSPEDVIAHVVHI